MVCAFCSGNSSGCFASKNKDGEKEKCVAGDIYAISNKFHETLCLTFKLCGDGEGRDGKTTS